MGRTPRRRPRGRSWSVAVCATAAVAAGCGLAAAAPPGEVTNLTIDPTSTLAWDATAGAADYNVYRGLAGELGRGVPPRCHGFRIAGTSYASPSTPPPGRAYAYLVTAVSSLDEEGPPGDDSNGVARALLGSCRMTMRNAFLDRVAFGWDEWTRDRLDALGFDAFVAEQLDPATIDESTNTELNQRIGLWTPPQDQLDLVYLRIDRGIYARRQLEEVATAFWQNHFTTFYFKTFEYLLGQLAGDGDRANRNAADVQLREEDGFRDLAFNGTFREMVEASTLSAAMMIYLDNVVNVVGNPNENYARELLELHTMGVDRGYTEQDIRELARVFTGWEVCKKAAADVDDPLAPCIDPIFGGEGLWTSNFNVGNHDHTAKTLFAGTPYETLIPDTSANPSEGINDVQISLDAIVAHPSTPSFIAEKLLRHFITDAPTQAMIDAVVAEWNDATNPLGVGDNREVLRAVLDPGLLLDPVHVRTKIKTPQEHLLSVYRGLRGKTDPSLTMPLLFTWLDRMDHLPYHRVSPDGYPDFATPWLGTNQFLDRQDFAMTAAVDTFFYRTEVNQMVADAGLTTAEEIVDFFSEILLGGELTPAERQQVIDYLSTDALGNPSPFDDARVRETVGFMLGLAPFFER